MLGPRDAVPVRINKFVNQSEILRTASRLPAGGIDGYALLSIRIYPATVRGYGGAVRGYGGAASLLKLAAHPYHFPSFILAILTSGSCGFSQSSLLALFFRFLSIFTRSSRVGVSIPDAFARPVRNSW